MFGARASCQRVGDKEESISYFVFPEASAFASSTISKSSHYWKEKWKETVLGGAWCQGRLLSVKWPKLRDEKCEVGDVVCAHCLLIVESFCVPEYDALKWRLSFVRQ